MQLSPETIRFIQDHRFDDVRTLALQAGKYPHVDIRMAATQIAGRQSIAEKVPLWYETDSLLYPPHLSIEQCSSQHTAIYKTGLLQGDTFTDLTGGLGIDCAFLSAKFSQADYVERNTDLCQIASHNFPLLGVNHIRVHNCDSVDYLEKVERVDCIFIDPARRNTQGRKTVAISDCDPDVALLQELLLQKAGKVLIKLSPMLDLTLALQSLNYTKEVHIVSVNNECKELLLLLVKEDKEENRETPVHCINISSNGTQTFVFSKEKEQQAKCNYTDSPGAYLYEPNASLLKAGAFKSLAADLNLSKLHPNSHLYTSDVYVDNFPGRSFKVTGCSTPKDKSLLAGIKKANIAVRNYPSSPQELKKRLKLYDGGDIFIFATTLQNERKVLIKCVKA